LKMTDFQAPHLEPYLPFTRVASSVFAKDEYVLGILRITAGTL
jgi:hypothetical protein